MNIWQNIRNAFNGSIKNRTLRTSVGLGFVPNWDITKHRFGETMYLNIVELLTDIYSEVVWMGVETPKFLAWKDWANRNGQRILVQMYREKGYAVIGYDSRVDESGQLFWRFYELPETAYRIERRDNREIITPNDEYQQVYVLRMPTFEATGKCDREWCKPFIAMLDAVLNGATTTAERLGAYVVMSPKTDNFGGVLTEEEKNDLEKQTQKEYGMISRQKQIMVLPRPMDSQIVSLSSVDTRLQDKARTALLGIADRIKVPANQIAFIDSNSSKSLSNGTELREGDMAKYRQFRRVLNATFYDMAVELGMKVDYTIENEPKSVQGQTIENGNNL